MAFFEEFPATRTYDSDLGWLIRSTKKLIDCCDEMTEWKAAHEPEYEKLKELYNELLSGELPPAMEESIENWFNDNALSLVGDLVHNVSFGLTNSGYFVAYIPEGWSDITFHTTGLDITLELEPEYGHLVLSY